MVDNYAEPLSGLDRYAVVGNPIAHSKSPIIHEAFAKQTQQNISYERVLAPLDGFSATVKDLVNKGYKGVNVTVPFKFEAYNLASELRSHALDAGAANTLLFNSKGIVADNTDGAGLVRDLLAQGIALHSARILLLGAGGAARGVIGPLLQQAPKCLVIANRSNAKADELVKLFADLAAQHEVALESRTLADLESGVITQYPFDLIINATAAGLSDESPISSKAAANIFVPSSFAYDMVYGKTTAFMQQALQKGARVSDGLGMLVEQAADAFLLWRGTNLATAIDSRAVLAQLRS